MKRSPLIHGLLFLLACFGAQLIWANTGQLSIVTFSFTDGSIQTATDFQLETASTGGTATVLTTTVAGDGTVIVEADMSYHRLSDEITVRIDDDKNGTYTDREFVVVIDANGLGSIGGQPIYAAISEQGNGTGGMCPVQCGDGIKLGTEECDDGNVIDGDGCDSNCVLESACVPSIYNTDSGGVANPTNAEGVPDSTYAEISGNNRVSLDMGGAKPVGYQVFVRVGCPQEVECKVDIVEGTSGSPGGSHDTFTLSAGEIRIVSYTLKTAAQYLWIGGYPGGSTWADGIFYCGETLGPLCGDGTVDGGEQCDDGNLLNNDGCSSTCQDESATCSGPFSPVYLEHAGVGSATNAGGSPDLNWTDNFNAGQTVTLDLGALYPAGTDWVTYFIKDDNSHSTPMGFIIETSPDNVSFNTIPPASYGQVSGAGYLYYTSLAPSGQSARYIRARCDGCDPVGGDILRIESVVACTGMPSGDYCGDGMIGPGEESGCDDGNLVNGDGCSDQCEVEACSAGWAQYVSGSTNGDGANINAQDSVGTIIQYGIGSGIVADLGKTYPAGTMIEFVLNNQSQVGIVDINVACSGDNSTYEICHNFVINSGAAGPYWQKVQFFLSDETRYVRIEQGSPDTFLDAIAICGADTSVCGDGVIDAGEDCDDGNIDDGDGCSSTCSAGVCSNWLNTQPGAPGLSMTNVAGVNDGVYFEVGPTAGTWAAFFDSGPHASGSDVEVFVNCPGASVDVPVRLFHSSPNNLEAGAITYSCNAAGPTSFVVTSSNTFDSILFEDGGIGGMYEVDAARVLCGATCGNGVTENGEGCDDGNTNNGDGCDATCQSESCSPGLATYVNGGLSDTDKLDAVDGLGALTSPGVVGDLGLVLDLGQVLPAGTTISPIADLVPNNPAHNFYWDFSADGSSWSSSPGNGEIFEELYITNHPVWHTPNFALPISARYIRLLDTDGQQVRVDAVGICGFDNNVCGDASLEGEETCDDGNNNDGDSCAADCGVGPTCEGAYALVVDHEQRVENPFDATLNIPAGYAQPFHTDFRLAYDLGQDYPQGTEIKAVIRKNAGMINEIEMLTAASVDGDGTISGTTWSAPSSSSSITLSGMGTEHAFVISGALTQTTRYLLVNSSYDRIYGVSICGADTNVCGDGVVAGGEACDDGNNIDGDGCSTDCSSGSTVACNYIVGASGTGATQGNAVNSAGSPDGSWTVNDPVLFDSLSMDLGGQYPSGTVVTIHSRDVSATVPAQTTAYAFVSSDGINWVGQSANPLDGIPMVLSGQPAPASQDVELILPAGGPYQYVQLVDANGVTAAGQLEVEHAFVGDCNGGSGGTCTWMDLVLMLTRDVTSESDVLDANNGVLATVDGTNGILHSAFPTVQPAGETVSFFVGCPSAGAEIDFALVDDGAQVSGGSGIYSCIGAGEESFTFVSTGPFKAVLMSAGATGVSFGVDAAGVGSDCDGNGGGSSCSNPTYVQAVYYPFTGPTNPPENAIGAPDGSLALRTNAGNFGAPPQIASHDLRIDFGSTVTGTATIHYFSASGYNLEPVFSLDGVSWFNAQNLIVPASTGITTIDLPLPSNGARYIAFDTYSSVAYNISIDAVEVCGGGGGGGGGASCGDGVIDSGEVCDHGGTPNIGCNSSCQIPYLCEWEQSGGEQFAICLSCTTDPVMNGRPAAKAHMYASSSNGYGYSLNNTSVNSVSGDSHGAGSINGWGPAPNQLPSSTTYVGALPSGQTYIRGRFNNSHEYGAPGILYKPQYQYSDVGIIKGLWEVCPNQCGNSMTEGGETCDDGNLDDGDGCNSNCQIEPLCGNNVIDTGEECDDGNTSPGDGCTSICTDEVCNTAPTTMGFHMGDVLATASCPGGSPGELIVDLGIPTTTANPTYMNVVVEEILNGGAAYSACEAGHIGYVHDTATFDDYHGQYLGGGSASVYVDPPTGVNGQMIFRIYCSPTGISNLMHVYISDGVTETQVDVIDLENDMGADLNLHHISIYAL